MPGNQHPYRDQIFQIIPNGAGKSTVLKAVAGLLRVTSGKVILLDEDISKYPPYQIVERGKEKPVR